MEANPGKEGEEGMEEGEEMGFRVADEDLVKALRMVLEGKL